MIETGRPRGATTTPAAPFASANGGLLHGPHAILAGPTFEEWLDRTRAPPQPDVRPLCEHVFVLTTNQKGAIAETAIAAAATKVGVSVLRPITEHARYDLAFEIGREILRVQCKWGALESDGSVVKAALQTCALRPGGYLRTPYTPDEIDLVAVYCGELDRCYLLPSTLACGRTVIHLRLRPPRNGQRACITLAEDFTLEGAVAQWNERPAGSRKVVGSNPTSSTSQMGTGTELIRLGSHQFRNHFGYYLERAAAGDEIHITRHGRPFAKLMPVEPASAVA
jgi:prevent-host-death family protein